MAVGKESGGREKIAEAIEEVVSGLGYECVHVLWTSDSGRPVIRVLIDSLGGINVGDCERVSRALNRCLDSNEEDPELRERYYLEVSSPGLERPLFSSKDYRRFQGKEARIKTFEAVDGRKLHVGILGSVDEESVTLLTEQGERRIDFERIARASLVYRGLEHQEPKGKGSKRTGKDPEGKSERKGKNEVKRKNGQGTEEHEEEH